MRVWSSLAITLLVCLLFYQLVNSATRPWLNLATNTEINQALSDAMRAHRQLAGLAPEQEAVQRAQYDQAQQLLAHMEVMQANRPKMVRRFNTLLLGMFVLAGSIFLAFHLWENRRMEQGLLAIRNQLFDLARGTVPPAHPIRSGIWLRMEALIQDAHHSAEKDRERLKSLEHLQTWQEAARRMAHEIRTPLTTLSQSLKRWQSQLSQTAPEMVPAWDELESSMREDLKGLNHFANQISSFAKVRSPQRETRALGPFLQEFFELYEAVWPGVKLQNEVTEGAPTLAFDRGMIRQVLVNLCTNAASAMGDRGGEIQLALLEESERIGLTVKDNGPGIEESVRKRLFEPYVSSKPYGQGTGLGLAISRKIMLEHGGDLACLETGSHGTTFVLWFKKES
ncbi:MAG: HAMP domain-containing histidine kinase [Acidobacteria bacterium]|nr:HAMP domain-containing histidine kinase [Acidobacteriota bacterium]MCB9397214.1 HAMP domain-containing histidine kinase [Acidobacteriota bacterium]